MVRGLVRGELYLPRGTDGRRRVGAFDEDAFTFLATALERANRAERWEGRTVGVRLVGSIDPPDPRSLEAILGTPVHARAPTGGEEALAEALREAALGTGPEWIVVVATDGPGPTPVDAPGEGAAALLVDDRPGVGPLPALSAPDPGSPGGACGLSGLFEHVRARSAGALWSGDWTAEPSQGPRVPQPPARGVAPAQVVSQGAFVPGPRYEESRASRWRFVADRCRACGERTFPSRGRCRNCRATGALEPEALPLDGATVVASTWIEEGGQPTEFDLQVETTGPYGVVLAEIAPDVRVTLPVTEARPEEVRIGSTVDTVLRRLYPMEGSWRYGRKARPAAPRHRPASEASGG